MSRIESIQSNISATMQTLSGEAPYSNLLRSTAGLSFASVLNALAHKDDVLPVLTAESLDGLLRDVSDAEQGWEICQEFVDTAAPEFAEHPNRSVKHGQAMLFFGTSPKYGKLATVSMDGFRSYRKKDHIVSTFAVRNTFGLGNKKAHRREVAVPGLLPNSATDFVQVNYDLQAAGKGKRYLSRYLILKPGKDGLVKIYEEKEIGQSLADNWEVKPKIGDFKKVGELAMEPGGIANIDSNPYYQAQLQHLIEVSK